MSGKNLSPFQDIKRQALRLVRLAHELEVPIIIGVRDTKDQNNIVDASGDGESLARLLLNSVHHVGKQLPTQFADDLVLGLAKMAGQDWEKDLRDRVEFLESVIDEGEPYPWPAPIDGKPKLAEYLRQKAQEEQPG